MKEALLSGNEYIAEIEHEGVGKDERITDEMIAGWNSGTGSSVGVIDGGTPSDSLTSEIDGGQI